MGTRISLGKGFTFGASGLRYGRSIPGVKRGYVSVGSSGTLITGGPLRHWEPARRTPSGAARCQGRTLSGDQCRNRATLGETCRIHAGRAVVPAATVAHQEPRERKWTLGPILLAVLTVSLILGFFAFWAQVDEDYARTHDSTGQPIQRAVAIDCATNPHPEYYYTCTPNPVIPAPYQGRPR